MHRKINALLYFSWVKVIRQSNKMFIIRESYIDYEGMNSKLELPKVNLRYKSKLKITGNIFYYYVIWVIVETLNKADNGDDN